MKITKKPKKVKIEYRKMESYYSCYVCPTCHIGYEGNGPNKNVKRFICDCGQELIVDNFNKN
jgi:hypothetical protein